MRAKVAKLLRKFVVKVNSDMSDTEFRNKLKIVKTEYNKTPKNRRFLFKETIKQLI